MPELPEVEVLRRSLEASVVGARIEGVRVWNRALREPVDARRLGRSCGGRRILAARRRAKYLLLDLEGGKTLLIHLGMSGRLTLIPAQQRRHRHEHVAFYLDSRQRLRFRDARRFGLVQVLSTNRLGEDRHLAHLGLEPLGEQLSGRTLQQLARRRRGPVKSFLMDGRIVVGLGNIYAAEALHRSGVHPRRSVSRISGARWQRLAQAVRETLYEAIGQGGTTLNDFQDALGEAGYFRISLLVYDREGQPCKRCGATVRRIIQAGRSTFYCPGCQH